MPPLLPHAAIDPRPVMINSFPDFAPGGFLGFSARGQLGCWINLGTLGIPRLGLTHVAPIARSPKPGDPLLVYEATSVAVRPCFRRRIHVEGVQAHPLQERIDEFDGRVWYYAPKIALSPLESDMLTRYCEGKLGTPYDTIGAFRARDLPIGRVRQRLSKEDLGRLFCSEFLAAAERHVNRFWARNASIWSPNRGARAATIGWPFGNWGAKPCFKWPVRVK